MTTDQDIYNDLYHVKQGLGLLVGPYQTDNGHAPRAAMWAFTQAFSGGRAQDAMRDPTFNALVRSAEQLYRHLRGHPQFNEAKWQKFLGSFGEDSSFTAFLSTLNDLCKSLVKPGMKSSFDDALKRTIAGWSAKPIGPPPRAAAPSNSHLKVGHSVYEQQNTSPRAPSAPKSRIVPNTTRTTSTSKSRPKTGVPHTNPYEARMVPVPSFSSPVKQRPTAPTTTVRNGFQRTHPPVKLPLIDESFTPIKTVQTRDDVSSYSPSNVSDLTDSITFDYGSVGTHTAMLNYNKRVNQDVLDPLKQQQYDCLYGLSGFMAQLFAYKNGSFALDRNTALNHMNALSHLFLAAIKGQSTNDTVDRNPLFIALYDSAKQVCLMINACYRHLQTKYPASVVKEDRERLLEATQKLPESHDFIYLCTALNKFLVQVAEGQSYDDFSNQLDRGLHEWRIALGGVRRPKGNMPEKSPTARHRLLTAVQDTTMGDLDEKYAHQKELEELKERLTKAEQEKALLQAQIDQAAKPAVVEVVEVKKPAVVEVVEVKKPALNPFKMNGGLLAQLNSQPKKEAPFDPSAYARDSLYHFLHLYKDSVSDEKSLVNFTTSGEFHIDNKRLATLLANIYGQDSVAYTTLLNYDQTMNNECDVVAYLENFHKPFIDHLEKAEDRMIAGHFAKAFKQWQKNHEKQIEAYLLNAAGDDTEKQRKVWAKIGIPGPVLKFIDLCRDYTEGGVAHKAILGFDEHQQFSLDQPRLKKLLEGVLSQEKVDDFFKEGGVFAKLTLKFETDKDLNAYIQDFHRLIKKILSEVITDHDKQLKFFSFFQQAKSAWNSQHIAQMAQYADRLHTDKPQLGLGTRSKSLSALSTTVGRSDSIFYPKTSDTSDIIPTPQEIRRRMSATINVSPALIADELYVDRKNRVGIVMPHAIQFLSGYRCIIAYPGTNMLPVGDRKEDTLYIQKTVSGSIVAYTHEKESGEVLPVDAITRMASLFDKVQCISDAKKISDISVILPPFVTMPKTEYSSVMLLPGLEKLTPAKMEKNVLYIQKTANGDTIAYSSDKPNGKALSADKSKDFAVYFDKPQAIDKPQTIEDRSAMEAILAMCSDCINSHLVLIVKSGQLEKFFANLSLSQEKITHFQHQLLALKEELSLHHDVPAFIGKLNATISLLLDFKEGSDEHTKLLSASATWQEKYARHIATFKAKEPPATEHSEHASSSFEKKDCPPHSSMLEHKEIPPHQSTIAKLFASVEDSAA